MHYRIDYRNLEEKDLTGVLLVDELDKAHVASVEEITGGGTFDETAFEIQWEIGALPAGGSGSVTYERGAGGRLLLRRQRSLSGHDRISDREPRRYRGSGHDYHGDDRESRHHGKPHDDHDGDDRESRDDLERSSHHRITDDIDNAGA